MIKKLGFLAFACLFLYLLTETTSVLSSIATHLHRSTLHANRSGANIISSRKSDHSRLFGTNNDYVFGFMPKLCWSDTVRCQFLGAKKQFLWI